jgi:hypothetical protein
MPDLIRAAKGLFGRMLGRRQPVSAEKRKVWRMAEGATSGEWVDPDAAPTTTSPASTRPADLSSGGWLTSSMDLLGGAEVIESHDSEVPTLPLGTRRDKK